MIPQPGDIVDVSMIEVKMGGFPQGYPHQGLHVVRQTKNGKWILKHPTQQGTVSVGQKWFTKNEILPRP